VDARLGTILHAAGKEVHPGRQEVAMRSANAASVLLAIVMAGSAVATVHAQGLVQGVQQGASQGSKAAGPVGGVLGGAIGGIVGVVGGVLGTARTTNAAPPRSQPQPQLSERPRAAQRARPQTQRRRTPAAAPVQQAAVTADQIVAASDANIARIKAELKLTAEQDKHWGEFNSAMHYLGRNGADRFNLRIARAQRDPPDDVIEQMRNEAQFLADRATDQRNVADAAEPLYRSLDARQKSLFVAEMVKLSRERGLD
jgi:hypothetical protein